MKKKLIILLGMAATVLHTNAQTVNYKVLEDNPDNVKKSVLHLDPAFMDLWTTNFTAGWGIRGEVGLGDNLLIGGKFRRASYLDMRYDDGKKGEGVTAEKGLSKMQLFEGFAVFYIGEAQKSRSMKVVLSSSSYVSGGTRYTSEKYIMVPGTLKRQFGFRGGAYILRTTVEPSDNKALANFSYEGVPANTTPGNLTFTMMRQVGFFGGIEVKKTRNLKIDTDNYGVRSIRNTIAWFLDVMLVPATSFADVKDPQNNTVYKVKGDKMVSLGWRMGWRFHDPVKPWMSYDLSFGARPSFQSTESSSFGNTTGNLDFTFGISVPF